MIFKVSVKKQSLSANLEHNMHMTVLIEFLYSKFTNDISP
jgi:hypothetical protein